MNKILQIIPVDGLYAEVIRTEEQDVFCKTEDGGRIIDTKLVAVCDEWGRPEYDYYSVVCLALMETDDGQEIHPLIVDDSDEPGTDLIDVTEWKEWYQGLTHYDGCDENSDSITIVRQDGGGFVTLPKDKIIISVEHEIDPDATTLVEISCIVDGKSLGLGYYSDDNAAKYVYDDFCEKLLEQGKYNMPSAEAVDNVIMANKQINAKYHAMSKRSDIKRTFTNKTAEVLIGAGCYTLDEVKALTKDILLSRTKRRKPETVQRVITELQERGYLAE